MTKRASWLDNEIKDMCQTVVPIKKTVLDPATAPPLIVNMVSTAVLLPQHPEKRYKLPLDAISMRLGCSQYAPALFAANIVKFTDSGTNATVLVFGSGRIVMVAGLSPNHTRYISQMVRTIIEQVQCMMVSDDKTVKSGTLQGRTIFENCSIHNIVGHGDLGCRIDLQAMVDAAPSCCKWAPDWFPGLKCRIWLNDQHKCICRNQRAPQQPQPPTPSTTGGGGGEESTLLKKLIGKQNKCTCVLKVLVFDSGRIVITGGRSVRDVNAAFFRIKHLAPQFKSGDTTIPKEDRFYQRLGAMLVPTGMTTKQAKLVQRQEMKPNEAVASVLLQLLDASEGNSSSSASKAETKRPKLLLAGGTPLMRMAEAGRVEDVKLSLEMDKSQVWEVDSEGRTPLDRMKLIPPQDRTTQHKEIMDILIGHL